MPITPRFELDETCTHLKVTIWLPHIRVHTSNMELLVDGNSLHFYASPYLLVLPNLPGDLIDDDDDNEAKAQFDPIRDNGILVISILKQQPILWNDLDMIGRFLITTTNTQPTTNNNTQQDPERKIQVLSSSSNHNTCQQQQHNNIATMHPNDFDTKNDSIPRNDKTVTKKYETCCSSVSDKLSHFLSTTTTEEEEVMLEEQTPKYGFLNQFDSVFTSFTREGLASEMLEIPFPDTTPMNQRQSMRNDIEMSKFDTDRYCNDTFYLSPNDDMVYMEAMNMQNTCFYNNNPHLSTTTTTTIVQQQPTSNTNDSTTVSSSSSSLLSTFFTTQESQCLASISSSVSVNSQESSSSLLLQLMDLMYAFVYNYRTTGGESNCESSWTISILSPTLSWLESYEHDDIASVLGGCVKRALTYPYLRSFDFCTHVLIPDVIQIFMGGRRMILRCLLQMHTIMDQSEFHYLNNKLYIDPFILWIQHLSNDSSLQTFAHQIQTTYDNMGNTTITTNAATEDDDDNNRTYKEAMGLQFLLQMEHQFFQEVCSNDDSSSSCSSSHSKSGSASKMTHCIDAGDLEGRKNYSEKNNKVEQSNSLISINQPTPTSTTTPTDDVTTTIDKDHIDKEYQKIKEKLESLKIIEKEEFGNRNSNNDIVRLNKGSKKQSNDRSLLMFEENVVEENKPKTLIEEIIR